MTAYTFDQIIDYTRTSAATYVDASGRIVPTPASRNLLTFTQEFDNAVWGKTASTVTANSTAAPDGTMTADTLLSTASASGAPRVTQTPTTVGGLTYTLSAYFRANGTNFAFLSFRTSSVDWAGAEFNLSTGAVSRNASVGTVTFNSAAITAAGGGWYRCSIRVTPTSVAQFIFLGSSDGTSSFVGGFPAFTNAGTESIYLWGAQLEAASAASTYTRNVGGVYPPRFDYDPVTLAPRGLLIEEQRTNLLLRSEEFDNAAWSKTGATVTANSTTSPDGTVDADTLTEDTSTGAHHILALPGAGVSTYTFSFFAKANGRTQVQVEQESGGNARFTLSGSGTATALGANVVSITLFPNGWYRCTTTFTVTGAFGVYIKLYNGSTASYTGDGTSGLYIWGAQLEAGAFATSYIPTVASQVTRTADVAAITGANFSQWYNQSEGTFVAEFDTTVLSASLTSTYNVVNANAGSTINQINLYVYNNFTGGQVRTGGVSQADINGGGSPTNNNVIKSGIAYAINNIAVTANGAVPGTDTSATLPTVDRLSIGNVNSATQLNGHIRSIRFYPTRLTNAQLQALTA